MRRWSPIILLSITFVGLASGLAALISVAGSRLFGEWQLLFLQMKSPSRWLLLCAACGIAVALIATLHSYERRLVTPRLGRTLLALRLLLILIVFLTLLEPVWSWSYEDTAQGRVVVALDVSESMDTNDIHANLAEKLRWGRALGLFGQRAAREQTEHWIQSLETGQEPVWVTAEEEPNPLRRQQQSDLRKQDLISSLQALSEFSRLELAAKTLTSSSHPVLQELAKQAQTEISLFATDQAIANDAALEQIVAGEPISMNRGTSDLTQAMNAAIRSESDVPLAGVVLISDGRDTSSNDQQKLIQRLSGLGVPVHTVLVGSQQRPRDLSISFVDAPETVFEDDSPLVKAIVNAFGFEGEELKVTLTDLDDPDSPPIQQVLTANQATMEVALTLNNLKVGRHRFRVQVDEQDRELRSDNNIREFSLNVVDDQARVLVLEGEGRWEFRYLSTALRRDKRVDVEEVLFEQPFLGVLDQPFFKFDLNQLQAAPRDSTRFADYDCIVIGDVSPRHLPLERWLELERYVRDEGGTIVLTAGKRYFPMAYRGTVVDSLLPIENLRAIRLAGADQALPPPQRGFHFSVTPDGEQTSIFQLGDDWNSSQRIWRELPGHSWGITGDAKGAATVYAAAISPGERLTLETERQNGIVVQHFVGSGQVVWLGVDSTWRWRFRTGDKYHHRFWGQLIRWAVGFKAAAANQNLRLALSRSVIHESESTRIQARWDDRFLAQHPLPSTTAIISATDGTDFRKRVELTPDRARPFLYEAEISELEPGEYRITLESTDIPLHEDSPEVILVVREEVSEELADVSADKTLLQEIATATQGKFFYLDQAEQIPELFAETEKITTVAEEIPLWSHWIILALFSVVAMTEWVTRKINGLP